MWWRRLIRTIKLLLLAAGFVLVIAPEWPAFGAEAYRLNTLVGQRQFDFLLWELNALAVKTEGMLANHYAYLPPETQKQIVLDYLDLNQKVRATRSEINAVYADPGITDADLATAALQAQLAAQEETLAQWQPLAEAIVQQQVGEILAEEGFTFLGGTWPPVMMHMTPLPSILIVSPRERIERIYGIPLVHGMPTPAQEELETAVFDDLKLSALVVPIGGLGVYPAMILETNSINWLADVVAHEWAHHWMGPYPISINYITDPHVRTMNETTASILGREVGEKVIGRFYPEYAPPPAPALPPPPVDSEPATSLPFDFQAEMAKTRVRVDELLAADQVEAAEAYMEERRQLFLANGYQIRKLNQAYFAFYGAYADEPGATGADPVGPLVQEVRALSPSLQLFMERMAPIGSFAELEALVSALRSGG